MSTSSCATNDEFQEWFIQVPNDVVLDKRLSGKAFKLLAILFTYAGADKACWPGQKRLAGDLGVTIRWVRVLLHQLQELGLIRTEYRDGDTNRYVLLCKVIPKVSHKVVNNKWTSGGGRNGASDKVYPKNYNHYKGGYPPKFKNNQKGNLPGWVKIKGLWVKEQPST